MYKEILTAMLLLTAFVGLAMAEDELSPLEELGKALFFDTALSTPPGQSCATCHAGEVGWTGPDSYINNAGSVYPGAVHERYGNRKPPSAAYGGESPVLYYDEKGQVWVGGMFWDGRATGWELGDPLAEQAMGPFLNPLEQNNPDKKQVCLKVINSDPGYAKLFIDAWGEGSLDCVKDVDGTYERIARSIAAYERSTEVSAFTSKYDLYLKGDVKLTEKEKDGLKLFNGKGNCANCHISKETKKNPPLFTDFTYDNLGIPKNMDNPFYTMPTSVNPLGEDWVDLGLGGFLMTVPLADYEPELGKMKVPTLRNVGLGSCEADPDDENCIIKAYSHNGYFKSLYDIVHFYNTRDDPETNWEQAEFPDTVNTAELGDLGLTEDEEYAIVAFMQTLSDGYVPDE